MRCVCRTGNLRPVLFCFGVPIPLRLFPCVVSNDLLTRRNYYHHFLCVLRRSLVFVERYSRLSSDADVFACVDCFCADDVSDGRQESLALSTDEAQETLVALLESRAKGILENVKADAMEGRDGRILEAAERLLKCVQNAETCLFSSPADVCLARNLIAYVAAMKVSGRQVVLVLDSIRVNSLGVSCKIFQHVLNVLQTGASPPATEEDMFDGEMRFRFFSSGRVPSTNHVRTKTRFISPVLSKLETLHQISTRIYGVRSPIHSHLSVHRVSHVLTRAILLGRYCRLAGGMEVEHSLDKRERNVVLNSFEAKHAGSIESGAEGEAEARAKVAEDLGESCGRSCLFLSSFSFKFFS